MLAKFLLVLAFIAVAFAGASAPAGTKISASVKDTKVEGLDGFNVKIAAPYKFQDYTVGFNYALGSLKRAPESLFVKRSFETAGDGSISVDADYNLSNKLLSVASKWSSDELGLKVTADANSNDRITLVGVSKDVTVNEQKFSVGGVYDLLKAKYNAFASIDVDSTKVNIDYDSESQDPVLKVTRSIDAQNEVSPSVSLKTGDVSYGYTRKWEGGSLKSVFFPGDRKLDLEWTDRGAGGKWVTSAEIPLDNKADTKVSFGREWDY